MKVTFTTVQYLWSQHYHIISEERVTEEFTKLCPKTTGWNWDTDFPKYLAGCEKYYQPRTEKYGANQWELKPEYRENRPTYKITITYTLYDVELTANGKREATRRYNIHKRNMEKYAKLLG